MQQHNPANERIKRRYFSFLKAAKQQSEASIDAAAEAIARFEAFSRYRDFKAFHFEQAIRFRDTLPARVSPRTGEPLSKATVYSTLMQLKRFFQWLAGEPGYRSRLKYADAEYFNPSGKDSRAATARRERPYPSLEQILHTIRQMPTRSPVQRRDRALLAFTLLAGARDSATASLRLKHIDIENRCVYQDAREVNTKFSKSFSTFFFAVDPLAERIVSEWVNELRTQHLYGPDDPLFPSTRVRVNDKGEFAVDGLTRSHWKTATPIRQVFRAAFEAAGLPYFNPHSLRKTLVAVGQARCQTPEEYKAWSQNLGHEGVLTTLTSYGAVSSHRQRELIAHLAGTVRKPRLSADQVLALLEKLQGGADQ